MKNTALPLRFIVSFSALFGLFLALNFMNTAAADGDGTKTGAISHTPSDTSLNQILSVAAVTDAAAATPIEYISPVFTAEFPFNGVGIIWNGPASATVEFALSVDAGPWQPLPMTGEESKDQIEQFTSIPLFVHGQNVQYKITGPDVAQVRNVRVMYFDSTVPPQPSLVQSLRATLSRSLRSGNSLPVISRADWGADESYRFWEPEYRTPKKIVLHHTAGGNGGDDPAVTIRGIYYWQAVVLGWGDIGYNYLIDQQGNIYEGRAGGLGTIGAHTYNSDTDTNYNVGSIGVAVLGCFETTDGACTTLSEYTTALHTSIATFIGELAWQANIDPAGGKKWFGEQRPNILTHQDLDYTYCPGDEVYVSLELLRQDAATKYLALQTSALPPYQAHWESASVADTYTTEDVPTIDLAYTNVGAHAWTADNVVMQLSITETGQRQRVTLLNTVDTGATLAVTTPLTLLPHHPGNYTLISKLYQAGEVVKKSTRRHPLVMQSGYQAAIVRLDVPVAIRQGWEPTMQFEAKNTGSKDWPAGTVLLVNNEVVYRLSAPLAVGASHAVSIPLRRATIWPVGNHRLIMRIMYQQILFPDSRTIRDVRVDP